MRTLLALAALALSTLAASAAAQPRQVVVGGAVGRAEPRESRRAEAGPLKEMFGVPVAERLIQADDTASRIRGIERLGAIGTTEAIDALVEQIEQGAPAARDPKARLATVRVLAPYTKRDNVRQLLTREATDGS